MKAVRINNKIATRYIRNQPEIFIIAPKSGD